MKVNRSILALGAVAVALTLGGCASVNYAPDAQDAKAKQFTTEAGKGGLYIYRNESFGGAVPMGVTVNGRSLGQTGAKSYFKLDLLPGRYTVESQAENVMTLPVEVEAGKLSYVWQEVKMGVWMARSLLQQVDEAKGKAGVGESKLIAATATGADIAPAGAPSTAATAAQPPQRMDVEQRLRALQQLRKDGVINEADFEKRKAELLKEL